MILEKILSGDAPLVPGSSQNVAALDLGTNNCRLLIANPTMNGFRVVDAFSRIVRLGEGLTKNGQLSVQAMNRTLNALQICADKISDRQVITYRAVATEACRRAVNGLEFIKRIRGETGLNLEIISNYEEAELAVIGCLPLLARDIPHSIVFDIGGGTTELAWLYCDSTGRLLDFKFYSMPIGVATLLEKHGGDRFDAIRYKAMIAETERSLASFEVDYKIETTDKRENFQMIGTSGTMTTLAGLHLGLERYDRKQVDGKLMSFSTIRKLAGELASLTFDKRACLPCIGYKRADLVVPGCAILEAICNKWPVGQICVADRGVREGILCGLLRKI